MWQWRLVWRVLGLLLLTQSSSVLALEGGDKLRYIGRFDHSVADTVRFTWPGSAIEFRFRGSEAKIELNTEQRVRFLLSVDGAERNLWLEPGKSEYLLAQGLPVGEHTVRLTRLAESFSGVTSLVNGPIVDGQLLAPAPAPQRRLLVIGDSITAGYGVEGDSQHCKYSQETSNPTKAYAGLAANKLQADLHTIAWSGIGVWRSYGEEQPKAPTIGERRTLTLADDFNSSWQSARYQPHAVIVTIGTNDFWQGSAAGYQAAMQKLLADLQRDYQDTPVYLVASPMLTGEVRKQQVIQLQSLASDQVKVIDLGRIEAADGFGCDWHPNEVTNQRMADALVTRLKQDLAW